MAAGDIHQLLDSRRVLLCVGCGGVGKTTTCAALGLEAARRGKRVLCLTVDPARRLAESLGLESVSVEAQQIAPEVFAEAGLAVSGSLTVMMVDTKRTFDSLVTVLADSDSRRESILNNALYQYISTSLAGTQEYMAMEKLYAVKDDPNFDLILLDTPPTSHALDFLDAPQRLVNAIDSAAVRWFLQAFESGGKLSFNLLQRSAAVILKGMSKITGGGFLEQVASFLTEMNALFGGWRARADQVATALRGPGVAYVLVTTPDPMCVREVLFFAQRLRSQGMSADAYVVNRVNRLSGDDVDEAAVARQLSERGLQGGPELAQRVIEAARQENRLAELDRLHLIALEEAFGENDATNPIVAYVPAFHKDIHDVERLAWVADALTA